jgi:hypothetical protein
VVVRIRLEMDGVAMRSQGRRPLHARQTSHRETAGVVLSRPLNDRSHRVNDGPWEHSSAELCSSTKHLPRAIGRKDASGRQPSGHRSDSRQDAPKGDRASGQARHDGRVEAVSRKRRRHLPPQATHPIRPLPERSRLSADPRKSDSTPDRPLRDTDTNRCDHRDRSRTSGRCVARPLREGRAPRVVRPTTITARERAASSDLWGSGSSCGWSREAMWPGVSRQRLCDGQAGYCLCLWSQATTGNRGRPRVYFEAVICDEIGG